MKVLNERNWQETTNVETLKNVIAEAMGPRHCPVNHGEALQMFSDRLHNSGLEVSTDRGLLSPDQKKYVYVADINDNINDYKFTIGFVNYNNRQKAFSGIAGERVMV
jgi:hypothetical protein